MRLASGTIQDMIIVLGRKMAEMTRAELLERIAPYGGVDIDVGTGDGRFVQQHAREHPERFVIGLDPVADNMAEIAGRSLRKRTRLENALFVMASVEQMPAELAGLADRVFVLLPWGSLMRGLILAEPLILANLAWVARPGAEMRVVLNLRIFDDPVPLEVQDLPDLTPEDVNTRLAPVYRKHGWEISRVRMLPAGEMLELSTTWAKRLSHRNPPPSLEIVAIRAAS